MTVKLNLTVNDDTASAIKQYARRKKTSVSKIAEELFTKTLNEDSRRKEAKDFIEKYAGSVKIPFGENWKEELGKAIEDKHHG